jgi:hypothetical protein
MNRERLGWVVACLLAAVCAAGAMQPQGRDGRYQLVPARVKIVGQQAVVDVDTVFRIDTVTGETVEFMNGPGIEGTWWAPVSDRRPGQR